MIMTRTNGRCPAVHALVAATAAMFFDTAVAPPAPTCQVDSRGRCTVAEPDSVRAVPEIRTTNRTVCSTAFPVDSNQNQGYPAAESVPVSRWMRMFAIFSAPFAVCRPSFPSDSYPVASQSVAGRDSSRVAVGSGTGYENRSSTWLRKPSIQNRAPRAAVVVVVGHVDVVEIESDGPKSREDSNSGARDY